MDIRSIIASELAVDQLAGEWFVSIRFEDAAGGSEIQFGMELV